MPPMGRSCLAKRAMASSKRAGVSSWPWSLCMLARDSRGQAPVVEAASSSTRRASTSSQGAPPRAAR